jgi:hypothetical protein
MSVSMTTLKQKIEPPVDLISDYIARETLKLRFPDTTGEEFAMWAWSGKFALENKKEEWILFGKNTGGFTCYFNRSESALALEGHFNSSVDEEKNRVYSILLKSLFSQKEIDEFSPPERWIPYKNLLERWMHIEASDKAEKRLAEKINSGELEAYHPFSGNLNLNEHAVFGLSQIEDIEKSEFGVQISMGNKNNPPTNEMIEASSVWTFSRLDELYKFHQNEKITKKNRSFKKATAEHFNISTKRVEQLLLKYEKIKPNKLGMMANQILGASPHK